MVSPIQYSYEQNTIRAYKSISYKVTFAKSNTKTYAKVSMQNLVVTDAFLHNTTINGFQQPVTLAETKARCYTRTMVGNSPGQDDKRNKADIREFGIRLVCKQFQLLCLFNMHWQCLRLVVKETVGS